MIVIIRKKSQPNTGLLIQTNTGGADVFKYVDDFESELIDMSVDVDITSLRDEDIKSGIKKALVAQPDTSKKINKGNKHDKKPDSDDKSGVAESRYSRKSEPFVVVNELLRRKR